MPSIPSLLSQSYGYDHKVMLDELGNIAGEIAIICAYSIPMKQLELMRHLATITNLVYLIVI
jgi:hypothetical protein